MAKLALVTGGSRGIGAVVVAQLRAAGWVVVAPTRDQLDFSDSGVGEKMREWVHGFGKYHRALGALVFCHGTWLSKEIHMESDWWIQYRLRVIAPWFLTELLLSSVEGGSVTMVASTQAFGGRYQTGPYGAACAAQARLMQGYAQSYKGIRFNTVAPGLTDTSMAAQVMASGDCRPDAVPQPPEAVAGAVLRLVTGDENGVVLRVVDSVISEARWSW